MTDAGRCNPEGLQKQTDPPISNEKGGPAVSCLISSGLSPDASSVFEFGLIGSRSLAGSGPFQSS